MTSGTEDSDISRVKAVFADEEALREVFARRPEILKEVLGLTDAQIQAKRQAGAFSASHKTSDAGAR